MSSVTVTGLAALLAVRSAVEKRMPREIRVGPRYGCGTTIEDFDRVLEAAAAGDEWAAAVLFDALQPSLLRYLRWAEPGASDDVAGDTWLAVAGRIKNF